MSPFFVGLLLGLSVLLLLLGLVEWWLKVEGE
jgi:hypothetical protein